MFRDRNQIFGPLMVYHWSSGDSRLQPIKRKHCFKIEIDYMLHDSQGRHP
jgi:hypothetical protein